MYYKFMFTSFLMLGTLISISSYSWMSMWMGLEINLLSIIPLMNSTKNMMASEAALKYFITQTIASTILMFTIIILSIEFMYNLNMNFYISLILNTSLFLKMGAAPFHFWFPEIIEGLNWNNSMIMLTWQKIAPMVLFMYFSFNLLYTSIIIIASMMISGIMGLNQISLRKILAYSSINHIGWMIGTLLITETIWLYYFMIYLIITINITLMFKILNIFYLNQLFMSMNKLPMTKMFFIINFMSLGGLPPFIGFLPKWIMIQSMILKNFITITFIMTLLTLLTLYFYMRITFSTILLEMNEMIFYNHPIPKQTLIWTLNFKILVGLLFSTLMFNFM
uniref:NADH dehydrogenase subunit 2 n=1 Tax=Apogonia splendida TaxID=2962664 RepID=UPI002114615D|nr:NADH dehydrogenase subunit 2 [Apogonia splendida]UTE83825.1 NADH dehydrogenase subunit 2 [Apogonia splendida]